MRSREAATLIGLALSLLVALPASGAPLPEGTSPEPEQTMPLLRNGDFSLWVDGAPAGWDCLGCTTGVARDATAAERDPPDRRQVGCVRRGDAGQVVFAGCGAGIHQHFRIEPSRVYRVRLSARVRGDVPKSFRPAVCSLELSQRTGSFVVEQRIESVVIDSPEYRTYEVAQLAGPVSTQGEVAITDMAPAGRLEVESVSAEVIPTDFPGCFSTIIEDLRRNYPFTDATRKEWEDAVVRFAPLAAQADGEPAFRAIVIKALGVLHDPTLVVEWQLLIDKMDQRFTYYPPGATPLQLMQYADSGKHHLLVPCGFHVQYRGKEESAR